MYFLFKKLDYVIVNELIHNSKNSGYMKIIILKAFIIYFFIFTIQNTSSLEENYVSQEYKQNIQPLTATPKQQRTSKVIVNKLKTRHYKKYKFDDNLSSDPIL